MKKGVLGFWVATGCITSAALLAAASCTVTTGESPAAEIAASCGNPGEKVTIKVTGIESDCNSVTVVFPGGGRVTALRELVLSEVTVTIPQGAQSGALTIEGCGSSTLTTKPIAIPCPPDGSTPDAGGPDSGGPDAATGCTNNGTCDPNESCACADCTGQARCGSGCILVVVQSFNWTGSFGEGPLGADAGTLQGFGMGGSVGQTMLKQPTMQSECGSLPCFQLATPSGFFIQTSGKFNKTQAAPPAGSLEDVRFDRRVNGDGGAIGIAPDGGCYFLGSGKL